MKTRKEIIRSAVSGADKSEAISFFDRKVKNNVLGPEHTVATNELIQAINEAITKSGLSPGEITVEAKIILCVKPPEDAPVGTKAVRIQLLKIEAENGNKAQSE
jgi:hypothetical protein